MTSPLHSVARRGTVIVASLATAALALSVSPASADATFEISGVVSNADGPLEDVNVHVSFHDGDGWDYLPAVGTDDAGAYEVSGLEDGDYRVSFDAAGYATEYYQDEYDVETATPVIVEGASVSDIDATLEAGSSISGTMSDADEQSTEGYVLAFRGDDESPVGVALTDPDGTYVISGLPTGSYAVLFNEDSTDYQEFYDDADYRETADLVDIEVEGTDVESIDAVMDGEYIQDYLDNEVEPTITGTAQVGSTLTVNPGVWTPSDVDIDFSYQWYADDFAIEGATGTTYVPTSDKTGMWLTVRIVASADGFEPVDAETEGVEIAAGPSVTNLTVPTISGTPQVGSALTASPGTWDRPDATFTYYWETYEEGQEHTDFLANGRTYVPTAAIVGQPVWVTVVASSPGVDDGYAGSASVGPVTAPPAGPVVTPPVVVPPVVVPPVTDVDNTHKPKVQGANKVGSTLKAKVASWIPAGATVKYQWLVNGKPIKKATRATLKVTRKLKGKKVSVQVVATSAGSRPASVVTKVGKIK